MDRGHAPVDRVRFPVDEWALVETEPVGVDDGFTETLFALGNGYLGLRGNTDEGRSGYEPGTFVNGFHETWPIRHAEDAYGFARVGQTIVNAPDAKIVRIDVDDELLDLAEVDLVGYERRLDFRAGVLTRELGWRTASGKLVRVTSRRMVSFTDRHLVLLEYDLVLPDSDAVITITSQVRDRQATHPDSERDARLRDAGSDPRKAERIAGRVLEPRLGRRDGGRHTLAYRCAGSGMGIAVAAHHLLETTSPYDETGLVTDELAQHVYRVRAARGSVVRMVKLVAYHAAAGESSRELAARAESTLDRAIALGTAELSAQQTTWLDRFWRDSDVEIAEQPELQQATRWSLFQLAQATARTDGGGIAAKGVSGSGYSGHYFWDTEIYVLPFLTYTAPAVARHALRFRLRMLEPARRRARELNLAGALFPWRTINGLEASAYYPAGTAQFHIDADIAHALCQYVAATGDEDFLVGGAVDILVETARMWVDLGFGGADGAFHIHGVTGPDEYTTVVNDNLYTNVMARRNLESAAVAVEELRARDPQAYRRLVGRVGLAPDEGEDWRRSAARMHIPYDDRTGVHPQDAAFLHREVWDLDATPADRRPLMLHYHPLVIYRHQVLKQADVVLALVLQGDRFSPESKRADFDYYDPLTTGDSTLSAVAQAILAAEVGYHELALRYFTAAAFVDLGNLHRNTADGVHVASAGGVWSALVYGFGGFRDHTGRFTFDPRLPAGWSRLTFRLRVRGVRVRVVVTAEAIELEIEDGGDLLPVTVRGQDLRLVPGAPVRIPLDHQGPRRTWRPVPSRSAGHHVVDGALPAGMAGSAEAVGLAAPAS